MKKPPNTEFDAPNATRILFWNIGKRPLLQLVASLVHQRSVDILILAESEVPDCELCDALSSDSRTDYFPVPGVSTRLSIYSRLLPRFVEPLEDYGGLAIRHVQPPIGESLILAAVHLPSKLYLSQTDQSMIARRVIDKIRRAETDVGHSRTVVVGDFNMNPFEFGLVAADCFHAVMDTRIADKQSRKVQGEVRKFFYNPMWHLFRETFSAPLGTYYYNNSSRQRNYYWNTFDQVLVSPDLLDSFPIDQLSVLTTIGKIALVREDGRPDPAVGSDHLPILFDLAL